MATDRRFQKGVVGNYFEISSAANVYAEHRVVTECPKSSHCYSTREVLSIVLLAVLWMCWGFEIGVCMIS